MRGRRARVGRAVCAERCMWVGEDLTPEDLPRGAGGFLGPSGAAGRFLGPASTAGGFLGLASHGGSGGGSCGMLSEFCPCGGPVDAGVLPPCQCSRS